jgi:hypothetical protein
MPIICVTVPRWSFSVSTAVHERMIIPECPGRDGRGVKSLGLVTGFTICKNLFKGDLIYQAAKYLYDYLCTSNVKG